MTHCGSLRRWVLRSAARSSARAITRLGNQPCRRGRSPPLTPPLGGHAVRADAAMVVCWGLVDPRSVDDAS